MIYLLQVREEKGSQCSSWAGGTITISTCSLRGSGGWWDWLVAVWWRGHLARPQEAALPQCCLSSCNQKLPSARREDKPSKLPVKGHVATLWFCAASLPAKSVNVGASSFSKNSEFSSTPCDTSLSAKPNQNKTQEAIKGSRCNLLKLQQLSYALYCLRAFITLKKRCPRKMQQF